MSGSIKTFEDAQKSARKAQASLDQRDAEKRAAFLSTQTGDDTNRRNAEAWRSESK